MRLNFFNKKTSPEVKKDEIATLAFIKPKKNQSNFLDNSCVEIDDNLTPEQLLALSKISN